MKLSPLVSTGFSGVLMRAAELGFFPANTVLAFVLTSIGPWGRLIIGVLIVIFDRLL